jgi:hypothetical protein
LATSEESATYSEDEAEVDCWLESSVNMSMQSLKRLGQEESLEKRYVVGLVVVVVVEAAMADMEDCMSLRTAESGAS